MTRQEKFFQVIQETAPILRGYGVQRIGLFGSVSRGEDHEGSDYDVLIVFAKGEKNLRNFMEVSDLLEERLGTPVDLVTREGLSPYIGPHILQETKYANLGTWISAPHPR